MLRILTLVIAVCLLLYSSERYWVYHHLSVYPVGPDTHVLHHGISAEHGEV